MKPLFLSLMFLLSTLSFSGAAGVTITNSGFETDALGAGGWSDAVPAGWSDPQGGDNTNFMENISGFASDGSNHLGFDGNEYGMIYQNLSAAWAPNTIYTFTVGVGNRNANFGAGTGRFFLASSLEPLPPPGPFDGPYSLYTPGSGWYTDYDTSLTVPAPTAFGDVTFTYTTGAVAPTGNIRIGVQEISGIRLHVDNFRLDATAIPEPSAAVILAMAVGLAFRRRHA